MGGTSETHAQSPQVKISIYKKLLPPSLEFWGQHDLRALWARDSTKQVPASRLLGEPGI